VTNDTTLMALPEKGLRLSDAKFIEKGREIHAPGDF
jgi:hypothetical protein